MAKDENKIYTYVHGGPYEGWWWGCTHCKAPFNSWESSFKARIAAGLHRRDNPDVDWNVTWSNQW